MKVTLYGSTGRAGSRILRELLLRGHTVTAVVRESSKVGDLKATEVATGDLSDVAGTAKTMSGADAVISAYAAPSDHTDELVKVTATLIEAVQKSKVPRFLMVGGAGGLEISPGISLIDSGKLPPEWLPISMSHVQALELLQSSDIDWTYLAPSAYFEPGERTANFRLGKDSLLTTETGDSRISMEDYAIAMVDELEQAKHRMQRFTVGY